uniref:ATP-dependent DNA helicase n=1 Tax=Oryza sativa subsp. japonica TaxID=39947 RepID=Q6YTQ6_ORYSJ|nr:helicase-like protein [Oryza sativa Japonica Group]BAD03910.1 helicase-like protein [Oryza sativa Japonica Group]
MTARLFLLALTLHLLFHLGEAICMGCNGPLKVPDHLPLHVCGLLLRPSSLCVRFVVRFSGFCLSTSIFLAKASYPDRSYYGPPTYECPYCRAMFWYQERVKSASAISKRKIIYNLCCKGGRIQLPKLRAPPEPLASLLNYNGDARSKIFLRQIRSYNSMFAFSSMGAAIDKSINTGNAPYVFKINGVVHHRIGTLVPSCGSPPKFAQLYVYDPENELQNRLNIFENDGDNSDKADPEIIRALSSMLDAENTLVQSFRYARERVIQHGNQQVTLRLLGCNAKDDVQYNLPTNSEIAAIIVGDFSAKEYKFDVLVYDKGRGLRQISPLHPSYMALQYPLLFPYGERGFHLGIKYSNYDGIGKKYVTMPEYYRYEMHYRLNESNPFTCYGRLSDQIDVDIFSTIETNRLQYFIDHQKELRSESVDGIVDAIDKGVTDGDSVGKRVILPASFTGGRRYMVMNYQDAMAICRVYGPPDLFVTYTCNSKWQEIADAIRFITVLYTVEFQKRGLPHIHCLVWLAAATADVSASIIDGFICAEIPDYDTDRLGYELVSEFMMHGPCGAGFTIYRRRNDGRSIMKNGILLDNRSVVPYNMALLKKYEAHINVEWCNKSNLIKYLFKYITKGHDRARIYFETTGKTQNASPNHDLAPRNEILEYMDARFLSTFLESPGAKRSMLTEWFETNKKNSKAHSLTYCEFPKEWTWEPSSKTWHERTPAPKIGRIYYVHPTAGELYYLRMLLMIVKGAQSYADVRTYDGVVYGTYREACEARGLLEGDNEWHLLFDEAIVTASSAQLRQLFVTVLLYCSVGDVRSLFDKYWLYMTDDIHNRLKKALDNPHCVIPHDHLLNMLLHELIAVFANSGGNIKDFNLPHPSSVPHVLGTNRLIDEEITIDPLMLAMHADSFVQQLNNDQITVFNTICSRAIANEPGFFFVSGHGGTGKTFLWNTIIAKLRSQNKIVLAVASSGVASLLLPRGRTTHSRFKIPIDIDETSICNIKRGTMLAELLAETALIIWDEAPMTHRRCFEALDRTLRDILSETCPSNSIIPFGGKPIVLGGDFKQILPVIPKGSRQAIINASITNSELWKHVALLSLNINMRLLNPMLPDNQKKELHDFSQWVLAIGNGTLPMTAKEGENYPAWITIPDDLLVMTSGDKIAAIVHEVYSDFLTCYRDIEYLASRAIVCPTNTTVDEINDYIIGLVPGDSRVYLSCDTISKSSEQIPDFDLLYPPEFLNSINATNFPTHKLVLKEGVVVMLLRNLNQSIGLCNGTRLLVTVLGDRILQCIVLTGSNIGETVYIPRITLGTTKMKWPFTLQRRQFPVRVCYSMTINKSQGQTLQRVGVYLRKPVFTHGQLYVAISRVTSRSGLKILIENDDGSCGTQTKNIVYSEVLSATVQAVISRTLYLFFLLFITSLYFQQSNVHVLLLQAPPLDA